MKALARYVFNATQLEAHRRQLHLIGQSLRHEFKHLPLIAQFQRSLMHMKPYNLLPNGLKGPLIRIAYGL
jgi:hypothetical protein